jgi:cell wall-associated NlpC family hydrolase
VNYDYPLRLCDLARKYISRKDAKIAKERQAVIAAAMSWQGTPFHHEAMLKGVGVDCGMFLIAVYRETGLIPEFTVEHYSHQWHLHRSREWYLELLRQFGREIEAGQQRSGDVVIWKFGRTFSHAAIILNWPVVIHAVNRQGVVIDNVACTTRLQGRPRKFFSPFRGSEQGAVSCEQ